MRSRTDGFSCRLELVHLIDDLEGLLSCCTWCLTLYDSSTALQQLCPWKPNSSLTQIALVSSDVGLPCDEDMKDVQTTSRLLDHEVETWRCSLFVLQNCWLCCRLDWGKQFWGTAIWFVNSPDTSLDPNHWIKSLTYLTLAMNLSINCMMKRDEQTSKTIDVCNSSALSRFQL